MALSQPLRTETRTLADLVGNGRSFQVPRFQRDYAWRAPQWEDLWADCLALRQSDEARHFLGAIVLQPESDRLAKVIDGQQRLVTLSVLALAVLDRLQTLVARGDDPEGNAERARQLRHRFIGERDAASLRETSKLALNATDDGFYQDYLVQLREPASPRSLPDSNRALWEAFLFFRDRLREDPALADSGVELARLLVDHVARKMLFIVIYVEDELRAYSVFETLNARGLALSPTDLLKNHLFSLLRAPADQVALGRRWDRMITTVGQERFPEFLRFDLLTRVAPVPSRRLYGVLRDQVTEPADVFALIDRLEPRAERYAAAIDPDHELWTDMPQARPSVRALALFGFTQHIPALLEAWPRFRPADFGRLLRVFEVFALRYAVVGGQRPAAIDPVIHGIARAIASGQARSVRPIVQALAPSMPSDRRFESDFSALSFHNLRSGTRLARYLLSHLEAHVSGRAVDWTTDPASLEHILPQRPGPAWDAFGDAARRQRFVDRLGNLTLLERSRNRDLGDAPFAEKRVHYAGSAYHLTRRVDADAPDAWTPATIEARQASLARLAVTVWRVDV